jgi:cell division protein FtsL
MSLLGDFSVPRERTAPGASRAALRVIAPEPGSRGRRWARVLTIVVSLAACAVLFGTVCTHVLLTQGQAQIDTLNARLAADESTHQKLQVNVAQLESPGRIVAAARDRLGMTPPATVVYLTPGAPRVPAPTTVPPTTAAPTTTSVAPATIAKSEHAAAATASSGASAKSSTSTSRP